jgi:hypothetical protein
MKIIKITMSSKNNYIPGLPRVWHGGVRRGMITSGRGFL